MLRSIFKVLVVSICVLLLGSTAMAKTKIVIAAPTQDKHEMWDEAMAQYEKANPSIDLEMLYWQNGDELAVLLTAGMQADIVWLNNVSWNTFHRPNNTLLDLSPMIKSDPSVKLNDFFPGSVQPFNYAGGTYALPTGVGALALFYNAKVVDELGLGAPPANWDWSAYENYVARTVKVKPDGSITRFGTEFWFSMVRTLPFFDQNEVSLWDAQAQKALQPADRALEVFEFFDRNLTSGVIRPWTFARSHTLVNEGSVFYVDGPWSINTFTANSAFPLGVASLPRKRVTSTYVASNAYGVIKRSTHPNEAWQFLRYLTTSNTGIQITRKYMTDVPARREALDDWLKQPAVSKLYNGSEFARNLEVARDTTIGVPNPVDLRSIYDATMSQLWNRKIAPGAALENLRSRLNASMLQKK